MSTYLEPTHSSAIMLPVQESGPPLFGETPENGQPTLNPDTGGLNVHIVGRGGTPATGQQTMANSSPVVIASDQSPVPVTDAPLSSAVGATNESAASSDTATSGLNGLFKRLLQQFATFLSRFPAALGQTTMAGSLPVTFASNQSALPISGSISATITSGSFNEAIPATIDIVGNSLSSTGTLYDIPAGRTFRGSFSIAASISVLGTGNPTISIAPLSGDTIFPAAGTKLQVVLSGLALTAVATSNTINDVYINGGSNGVRVTFTQAATGLSSGQISGRLL